MQLSFNYGDNPLDKDKPQNDKKKELADKCGLWKFVDQKYINIQLAWDEWYIDEIKWLFFYMLHDLPRYKKFREDYKKELLTCIELFWLSYFDDKDVVEIEKFLLDIQKYFIKNSIRFNNYDRNEYIKNIFRTNIDALGSVGKKIDESSRASLIISLHSSYIGSKNKPLEERKLRYNRIFLQRQLEDKKIYYPYGRKGAIIDITQLDIFNNL